MTRPTRLEQIADAILDGTPVDWDGIAARDEDRPVIEQLKMLAALKQARPATKTPPDSTVPTWGPLRVFERIGHGAFGDVHRAWDTRLDREVALKLLSPDDGGSDSPGSTVIEEGRLLARIRHPNVVTIYGAERMDGRAGLWMELISGRTLEQMTRDRTPIAAEEITRIGVELCRAVAAVHAAGLLHRDIKAQNVMVEDSGRVVLMDFGTGRQLESAPDADMTGTPLYLAPEVLAGGSATASSDVYGTGVVLFHLLTGSYPVQGRDLAELRAAHLSRAGTSMVPMATPASRLGRVIARALDPDPARRYATADAFAAALSGVERARTVLRRAMYAAAVVVAMAAGALWIQRDSPSQAALASWSGDAPVVAVLPFRNLNPEPGSDYFADGLTAEVIRNLALIDGLQVRSGTSSSSLKDKPRDVRLIRELLNVNLIVEADVLRLDDRLRINVQLVRVPDDVPLWSEKFDRTVNDVFAIQDEISRAIVNKLRLTLGQGQRRYQTSLPTYEAYLRARATVSRRGNESARLAASLFETVIAMDPAFAPAYAGLADAYAEMSWQLSGLSIGEGLEGMRPAAEKALELDPMLAEAHAAMGITYARERDWPRAISAFERALDLNPALTQIPVNYAQTALMPMGQMDKALQLLGDAVIMDPLSPPVRRDLAWAQYSAGRFDEAAENFRRALEADPGLPFATQGLARALTFAGKPDEAIDIWARKPPTDGDWERWLAHAYVRAGRRDDLQRLVTAHRKEHPYRQALIYSALGDKNRTFEALYRAVGVAPHRTAQLLADPEMALLRGDSRLAHLRGRLNLK